jgi:hypothetical protein
LHSYQRDNLLVWAAQFGQTSTSVSHAVLD